MAEIRIDFEGYAIDLLNEIYDVNQAVQELQGSVDDLSDEMRESETAASGTSESMSLLKRGAIALGGAFAAAKVKDFVMDSINLATAAEEAGNKFDAVYGPAAEDLGDDLSALGDKAGIADFRLQDMVATAGNVIIGLGGSREEAAAFAADLAPLAADVASFNGEIGDTPATLQAIISALTGERESLKQRGIVIHENDVVQQALNETGKATAEELTKLEKAQATYTLIVERSANAVGDLDRNLDSASTTQARARAEFEEQQVLLGQGLLPAYTSLLEIGVALAPIFTALAENIGETVGPIAALVSGTKDLTEAGEESSFLNQVWADTFDVLTMSLVGTIKFFGDKTIGRFTDDTKKAAGEVEGLKEEIEDLEDAQDDTERSSFDLAQTNRELADKLNITKQRTDALRISEEELLASRQSQVSNLTKLKRAADNLSEAQAELNELTASGTASEEELAAAAWKVVEAQIAMDVASAEFAESSGKSYAGALIEIGLEAGLAGEQLRAMVNAMLAAQNVAAGGIGGGIGVPDIIPPPGGFYPVQHGGVVRARPGGSFIQAGEAGSDEGVLPFNDEGVGFIADALTRAIQQVGGIGNGEQVTNNHVPINVYVTMANGDIVENRSAQQVLDESTLTALLSGIGL